MSYEDRTHNHEVLSDLFQFVYKTMKEGRGIREGIPVEYYIHRKTVMDCVEAAISKAERDALDVWRKQKAL